MAIHREIVRLAASQRSIGDPSGARPNGGEHVKNATSKSVSEGEGSISVFSLAYASGYEVHFD